VGILRGDSIGQTQAGLPIGMQIVRKTFGERWNFVDDRAEVDTAVDGFQSRLE